VLLNSPSHFEWTKKLLQTQFPSLIQQAGDIQDLTIPENFIGSTQKVCDRIKHPISSLVLEEELNIEQEHNVSPQSKKRTRKAKPQSPMVDSEVRRSNRVKEKFNGFKTSQCKVANCLGCSAKPPTMSADLLKSIGSNICQIPEEQLDVETLNKKKKTGVIAKKTTSSKPSKEDEDEKKKGESN
jgi:hypothetical protein